MSAHLCPNGPTVRRREAAYLAVQAAPEALSLLTGDFNLASTHDRLVLNVLLSFAQFEREMISERTRDKIAAARRKGKWSGGMPILGYIVESTKLIVDAGEAEMVRQIFTMYLEHRAMMPVVKELNARGWRTKQWIPAEYPSRRTQIQQNAPPTADQRRLSGKAR